MARTGDDDLEEKSEVPLESTTTTTMRAPVEQEPRERSALAKCNSKFTGESGDSEDENVLIGDVEKSTEKEKMKAEAGATKRISRGDGKPIRCATKIESKFLKDEPMREVLPPRNATSKARIEIIDDDEDVAAAAQSRQQPATGDDDTQQFLSGLEKLAGAGSLRAGASGGFFAGAEGRRAEAEGLLAGGPGLRAGMFSEKLVDMPCARSEGDRFSAGGDRINVEDRENVPPAAENAHDKTFVTKISCSALREAPAAPAAAAGVREENESALGIGRGKLSHEEHVPVHE